jgi:hypothetical protein
MHDFVPAEIRGLVLAPSETHEHICTDNVSVVEKRIVKAGVHAARKIDPDFASYDDALAFVCARIRVTNLGSIPPSNAQWQLF